MEPSEYQSMQSGFDPGRVSYLLESAELAEQGGNSRLAIHLYCAAFEASQDSLEGVDERTLGGLRQAWMLACEQGDRSTAEAIFNDLAPYNSDEQTQNALAKLQSLAIGQLEELGLDRDDIEDMAVALAEEMQDAGIDVETLTKRLEGLPKIQSSAGAQGVRTDLSEFINSLAVNPLQTSLAHLAQPQAAPNEAESEELPQELRYAKLAGFEHAKEQMRAYGIVDPSDVSLRGFLAQAESFHGVSGPVLSSNFLITGTSREDCGVFAQATATEIGWPVVTMIIDVNENGDGTIKVAAPVRRSIFGPPRITDLPNPCTMVIQNIDILQDLFWSEEQAFAHGGCPHRSLQAEILSYLTALMTRGGLFVIATSSRSPLEQPLALGEQLEALLGKLVEIPLAAPTADERARVLTTFAEDHPSFHDLDVALLARLSEGMSRYDLVISCHKAVEQAYSESLKEQRHQMVSLDGILTQFTQFLDTDSHSFHHIEDYLVARFSEDLEVELANASVFSQQIKLELDDDTQSSAAG